MSNPGIGVSDEFADLAALRAGLDAFAAAVSLREPIASVTDEVVRRPDRDIPLRVYRPAAADDAVLVWFHGGGYIAGSLAAIDPVCRALARRLGSTVVSVGYRLAPEHPFPAALDDALEAVTSVAAWPGASRVAIGGDSAGGGLAAAVARLTEVPLRAQVLLCPFLDATLSCPSVLQNGEGNLLTATALRQFVHLYLGAHGEAADPRVSPLLGTDFSGLPPAVVVTAGNDPLRDEGELYAARVAAAGAATFVRRWDGMVHGFVGMTAELDQAQAALDWATSQLRLLLDT